MKKYEGWEALRDFSLQSGCKGDYRETWSWGMGTKNLAVTLGSLLLILIWQLKQAKKDNRCVQSLFPKFWFGHFIIVGALQVGQ